jgi:flagellar biosynthesis protein FliR
MPIDSVSIESASLGFMLVLARVAGIAAFAPIPGSRAVPQVARVVLLVAFTLALFPLWPKLDAAQATPPRLLAWMLAEATIGLGIGLVAGFVAESIVFGLQAISVQAGYSYSSSIDPNSEADSGVLQVLGQLAANLLFFTTGMDRRIFLTVGRSLEAWPPGVLPFGPGESKTFISLGGSMMEAGLRLALPIAGLLLLTDITLALLGRLQPQLQLLSLSFPVKMLGTLLLLAVLAPSMLLIYRKGLERMDEILLRLVR